MINSSLQNRKRKRNDKIVQICIASIFVLVVIGIMVLFKLMTSQIKSAEKVTLEVSQQLAYNVHNQIVGDMQVLEIVAGSIGTNISHFKPEDLKSFLKNSGRQSTFQSFAYIKPNGNAYLATRNNEIKFVKNMSKLPCVMDALSGQVCFERLPASSEKLGTFKNIYTVPIYSKNKIVGVLATQVKTDVFKNILNVNTFNNTAFSHIVRSNGNYILRSENEAVENFQNMFDQPVNYIFNTKNNIKKDFVALKTDVYWTYFNKQTWLATYTPVAFKDWMIVTFVPGKVLALSAVEFVLFTIGLMLAINCFLFLILKRVEIIQRQSYEEMVKLAFYDEVTDGPNKSKFILETQKILSNVSPHDKYAMVLMDITKFKIINELYGFDAANVILKDVYNLIKESLPEKSLLARSIAATYLFVMKYKTKEDINNTVDAIYQKVEQYNSDKMTLLRSSNTNKVAAKLVPLFGVYLINDVTVPIFAMCDRVSLAKRTLTGNVNKYISYYDDNLRKQLLNEKNIEDEMHNALLSGQFKMYLQPKYDMKSLTVAGSEALIRWIHPTRGFIMPGEFIPLFEKNGFVLNVDRFIWEEACKAIKDWIDKGYKPVPISVNVSRLHLSNEFFIEDLKELLRKYQIPPELLELELTETATFEDFDAFIAIVNELKQLGFSIAMDDFGSGYSSLNMLRQIPCDILKLDRGFINDSTTDERGKIVVQHVLSMAKSLSLKTVSEGIENVDQAQFLTDSGCDIAQGFLYAKPMTLEDFEKVAFLSPGLKIEGLVLKD